MTTDDELRKLIALGEKATARPWRTWNSEYGFVGIANNEAVDLGIAERASDICTVQLEMNENCVDDAAYITAAANLAPEIAAELIAARFLVEQLRKAIESVRDVGWYSPVTPEYKAAWKKVDATLKGGDL